MTTPGDYAKFLLEYLAPRRADAFRLNETSRAEMLRPQIKKSENTWGRPGVAPGAVRRPPTTLHTCRAGLRGVLPLRASTERRSGLMLMLNGDAYVPFLSKMLANPSVSTVSGRLGEPRSTVPAHRLKAVGLRVRGFDRRVFPGERRISGSFNPDQVSRANCASEPTRTERDLPKCFSTGGESQRVSV